MTEIQTVSLLDLLPPNLRSDPTVSAAALSLDAELQSVSADISKLTYWDRLDSLTEEEADELAWQFHVDFYDPSLPIEQRRELVKNSYIFHRRKGTPSAVEGLITIIFGDGEVQEWWQYGDTPYRFRVITSNPAATSEQAQQFIDALNSVKNIRSHLDAVQITTSATMDQYYGIFVHTGDYLTIG